MRRDGAILADALTLHRMWKAGALGGEVMPEDARPSLAASSEALARYFTLGMTLNYQRSSYALWNARTATFDDPTTAGVFDPAAAASAAAQEFREALLQYKVALQPSHHPDIWRRNAEGLMRHAGGSVQGLLEGRRWDLGEVKAHLAANKPSFQYLSGPKISNYRLYVLSSYMSWPLVNRGALTIAPDSHVIAASCRLGLVSQGETDGPLLVNRVAEGWRRVLERSRFEPIDLHTPLWLWSRGGFVPLSTSA